MNKLLVLTKVLLRNSLDSFGKIPKTKIQLVKTIFLTTLLLLAFSPMVVGFGYIVANSYDALAAIGQLGVLLNLSLSLVSMVIFVFGLFYVISVFYFSKDIENLLPLVCAGLTVFGTIKFHLGLWPAFLGIMIFFGGINSLLYLYLTTRGVRLFSALEN